MIDAAEPARPCEHAVALLLREIAATGAEGSGVDPTGTWELLGVPLAPLADSGWRPGAIVVGRPGADPTDAIALAARTGAAESRVEALLEARRGEAGERLRAGADHLLALAASTAECLDLEATLARHEAEAQGQDGASQRELEARVRAHTQELSAERLRLREILQAMAEPMLITDRDGRITMISAPAAEILDADPVALEGRAADSCFQGDALAGAMTSLGRGTQRRAELRTRSTGSGRDVDLRVSSVLAEDGEALGFVIALRDVTAVRELERLRDEFISNVSHEVRTPLATLRGVALTLLEDEEMDADDRQDFLRIVDREAQRLAVLTEDMLAMSRLEASHARPRAVPIDLRRHVTELEREFGPLCADSGVRLSVSRGAEPAVVAAEPGLLSQVGKNLVGNALKFTPRGGHIQLSVSVDGRTATLRVRDTGLGIPEADQAHVFDRFYRSSHAARTVPASGLGLALVKRIADAHGWTVGLESRLNEGTDVWVTMALADEDEATEG